MDLFSMENDQVHPQFNRLADRMRPINLDEYFGQEHIVGEGKLLRRAIEADQITSIILYGPPGCGKTTLAHIISQHTKAKFVRLNAVDATVKDVREVIEEARTSKSLYGQRTILFLDEVHRFNTARQDALLPAVENGTIIFIGATTENPFHHVNGALLSRSTLFKLELLTEIHTKQALKHALSDAERGLGFMKLNIDEDALEHFANMAAGDIRRALNALELAATTTSSKPDGTVHITLDIAQESIREKRIQADKSTQYDILSAFHKSIRGSSDAALFWFIHAVDKLGMDPMTFLRRLIVACSEDIGMANPQAMVQAVTAMDAYHKIGLPEAKYNIAQAILFAVESPKSNAIAAALEKAQQYNDQLGFIEVPMHLRDTHYKGASELGHEGYKYPHAYPNHYVDQQYMPDELKNRYVYEASEQGTEAKIRQNQKQRRK